MTQGDLRGTKGGGGGVHEPPLLYVRGEQLTRGVFTHSIAAREHTHWSTMWDSGGILPSVGQGPVCLGEQMLLYIFLDKEAQ